jgi:hypothetical protein
VARGSQKKVATFFKNVNKISKNNFPVKKNMSDKKFGKNSQLFLSENSLSESQKKRKKNGGAVQCVSSSFRA